MALLRTNLWAPLILLVTLGLNWPALRAPHNEGDEVVYRLLTEQSGHFRYTLRGTIVQEQPKFFAPSVYDRPIYYHPPFYNAVLLAIRTLVPAFPHVLLSILSTAVTAMLVFALTRRRGGTLAATAATAIYLLCPITLLVGGKVWSDAFLGALLFGALYVLDGPLADPTQKLTRGKLTLLGLLLLGASLVKTPAVLALPGLMWASMRIEDRKTRLQALLVVVLVPVVATVGWFAFMAYVSGSAVPGALGDTSDRFQNRFIVAMARKRQFSFFLVPLVLDPALLLIAPILLNKEARRRVLHLAFYALGVAVGYTLLALQGIGTYHNKYISLAIPALSVLAGLSLSPRAAGEPRLFSLAARKLLLVVCLLLLVGQWLILTAHPEVPEVDPHQFGWPVWLTQRGR